MNETYNNNDSQDTLCCPVCGSHDLAFTNGSYSTAFGCLGLLLFGWVGLLLGLLGLGSSKMVCKNCGAKWTPGSPSQASRSNGGCGCGCGCLIILIILALVGYTVSGCTHFRDNPIGYDYPQITIPPAGNWQYICSTSLKEPITLNIDANGTISGFSGVNYYNGQLASDHQTGRLTLNNSLITTLRYGENMELEQNYLQILNQADSWWINDSGELELYSDKGVIARFSRVPSNQ